MVTTSVFFLKQLYFPSYWDLISKDYYSNTVSSSCLSFTSWDLYVPSVFWAISVIITVEHQVTPTALDVDYRLGCSWWFYGFGFQISGVFFLTNAAMKRVWNEQNDSQGFKMHWSPAFQDSNGGQCQIPMRAAVRAVSSVWGRMGTFCEQKTEGVW